MRKVIGIVGEGPTDYMVLKEVIDHISGEENKYVRLQPEEDAAGRFGNGWKGVWKWCEDTADILDEIFYGVTPQMDLLIIQMDADVSRKEKEVHCFCKATKCADKSIVHPLTCKKTILNQCPVVMPCRDHAQNPKEYEDHLERLICSWLGKNEKCGDIIITIPCDSTDAWIVAAYQDFDNVEQIENPWETVIAKRKAYHGIRVPGNKKRTSVYRNFLSQISSQWESVIKKCYSARSFDCKVRKAFKATDAG